MYKLKDIISSGGTNPKINKAINRYQLSKKEKQDIIKEVKNRGGDAITADLYFKKEDIVEFLNEFILYSHTVRTGFSTGKAIVPTATELIEGGSLNKLKENLYALAINPKGIYALNAEGINMALTIEEVFIQHGIDINALPRITKEEFYNLQ